MKELLNFILSLLSNNKQNKENEQITKKEINEVAMEEKRPYLVTLKEIIGNTLIDSIPAEHRDNIYKLLDKINIVRYEYNKSMTVSSGYRSKEDHLRIYKEKAIKENKNFDESKVPMGSKHLKGSAVDIYDPKQELQKWIKENEGFLISTGLWIEDFKYTSNWVHFQCEPYGSYKEGKSIFFIP